VAIFKRLAITVFIFDIPIAVFIFAIPIAVFIFDIQIAVFMFVIPTCWAKHVAVYLV
jgi:hypothetical protein